MHRHLLKVEIASLAIVGGIFVTASALEDKEPKADGSKAVALCPLMDEPVDFSVSAATDEGPVFFCCAACIKKYNDAPDKYKVKVAAQRKVLADRPKVQVTCPVSGKPVDQKVSIEHAGQKVYFCCDQCPAEFQKDPAKYTSKLANSYTYQTVCPVMKEEIDPAIFADLSTGQRVYLCCKKCQGKLIQDPAKYAPNLESQGVHLDVEKLKGGKG